MISDIFDRIGAPILFVLLVILFITEGKFQLRKRVLPRWKRLIVNSIVSIPAFALLRFAFLPFIFWLAMMNQDWQLGLNHVYKLPFLMEATITFFLLDYSNYIWHILLHKLPILWRFHLVHHCDHDLDISTAFRFHFGEMIASMVFRGAAVIAIGCDPLIVIIYEIVFEAATQFHHTNLKLPFRLEKWLNKIIVTPRMHGIHHSVVRSETDSNYSVIFSWWDRIHKTIRLNIPQQMVVTGVPSYADPHELTIGFLWKLPFKKIRGWKDEQVRKSDSNQNGEMMK